jgi:hypothetical protein
MCKQAIFAYPFNPRFCSIDEGPCILEWSKGVSWKKNKQSTN